MNTLLEWAKSEAKAARGLAADTVYKHDARHQDGRAEAFEEMAERLEALNKEAVAWASFDEAGIKDVTLSRELADRWAKLGTSVYPLGVLPTESKDPTTEDKALRFDLDQAGIESREADAVELVNLRAEAASLRDELAAATECKSVSRTPLGWVSEQGDFTQTGDAVAEWRSLGIRYQAVWATDTECRSVDGDSK